MLLYTIALPVLPKLKTCIDKECRSSAYLIHRTLRPATYRNKKLKAFPIIPGFECFSGEQGGSQAGWRYIREACISWMLIKANCRLKCVYLKNEGAFAAIEEQEEQAVSYQFRFLLYYSDC